MPWFELAVAVPILVVFYHLHQFNLAPPPKPRWKAMFLSSAATALAALTLVVSSGSPLFARVFLIFGTIGMIVAVLVIRPRGDQLMR